MASNQKNIKDVLKLIIIGTILSVVLSLLPFLNLEGGFIVIASILFIASGLAANAHRSQDRRILKFIAIGRNRDEFEKDDRTRITEKESMVAFLKMVISAAILMGLSALSYYSPLIK